MTVASYTMTIAEMMNNGLTQNIFPATYDFYLDDPQARKAFEDKFIKHYYYREIGFESPFMFIQKLESHLLLNMPYWKQLYQTELESRDINFLLKKDLHETFMREIESENEINGENASSLSSEASNTATSNQSSTTNTTGTQTANTTGTQTAKTSGTQTATTENTTSGTTTNTHKESSLNDGVAHVSLDEGYLTGTSQDNGTSSQTSSGSQSTTLSDEMQMTNTNDGNSNSLESSKSSGTSKQEEVGKTLEKTDLISQGNIGITSSAQLLKEWREVLINMDKIIIESCNDLFMKIY